MPRSTSRGLVPIPQLARLRWREEEARAVLDHLDSSGLSVREFAAQQQLNALRLYRWRARLGDAHSKVPTFFEVKANAALPLEVVLRSGQVVRVHDGFDEDTLRRVVMVLDGQSSRC